MYDLVADEYADRFRTTEPEQPVELAMIDHFAALLTRPKDVLDAGCGAGRLLPVLTRSGCRPVGVDLSAGMVRRARSDHPEYATQIGSLSALPSADGCFDGVLSWYSTIHLAEPELATAVREIRRVLRPAGYVFVGFQAGVGVREIGQGMRALGYDIELERHLRTPYQMAEALRQAGFSERARLVRAPTGREQDDQAFLVAQAAA